MTPVLADQRSRCAPVADAQLPRPVRVDVHRALLSSLGEHVHLTRVGDFEDDLGLGVEPSDPAGVARALDVVLQEAVLVEAEPDLGASCGGRAGS